MWRKIFFEHFGERLIGHRKGLCDIYQFGTYTGQSMKSIWSGLTPFAKQIDRFFGFDSFCGLPDDSENSVQNWSEGQFDAREHFKTKSVADAVSITQKFLEENITVPVILIPGFFNESLTEELVQTHKLKPALYVDIDVDLYSSAVTVLDFLAKNDIITYGTIIGYDDWGGTPGWISMSDGESKAHREICDKYGLKCQELVQFGNEFPHVQKVFMCLGKS